MKDKEIKKGAGYLEELAGRLRRERIHTLPVQNVYGVQFVTWSRTFDRTGVTQGHYFGNCYQEAKQDFAVRAGLVQSRRLFSQEQLAEIYRSVQQTLYADLELTRAQEKTLQTVSDQITELLPEIEERQFQPQSVEQSM